MYVHHGHMWKPDFELLLFLSPSPGVIIGHCTPSLHICLNREAPKRENKVFVV